jgi:hypothetical protein
VRRQDIRTKPGTWGALLIVAAMFCSPPVLAQTGVPKYEVDPFWPKLPNNWVVGPLGGTCVDTRDHVFVLHRQEELTEAVLTARDQFAGGAARIKAPPVTEFDPEGNLVNSWGDMKVFGNYLHDCQVDKDGNLWIAAARSGFVQKFSHDGKPSDRRLPRWCVLPGQGRQGMAGRVRDLRGGNLPPRRQGWPAGRVEAYGQGGRYNQISLFGQRNIGWGGSMLRLARTLIVGLGFGLGFFAGSNFNFRFSPSLVGVVCRLDAGQRSLLRTIIAAIRIFLYEQKDCAILVN